MPDMGGFFAVICKGGAQMRNYCIYSQRKCTQEVFLHLFPEEVHRGFFASIPRGSALRRFSFASVPRGSANRRFFASIPRGSANRRVFCIYSQRKCIQEGFLHLFTEEVHSGGFIHLFPEEVYTGGFCIYTVINAFGGLVIFRAIAGNINSYSREIYAPLKSLLWHGFFPAIAGFCPSYSWILSQLCFPCNCWYFS